MLDVICIGFAEKGTPYFPVCRSNHSAIETIIKTVTQILHYYQSTRKAMHVWNWFWLDLY